MANPPDLTLTDLDVARMTRPEREERVLGLIQRAYEIYDNGIAAYSPRPIVASCILYSGGNDSTTVAHLFRTRATHAIHANTGIGVEATRQFVRDICLDWGLPLIEKHPPISYDQLVMERGFPGPAQHWKMYQRLKERCLDAARHDLGIANSRSKRAVFIAGRRRDESRRRSNDVQVPLHELDGSVIWVSPLAEWTKLDLTTYRLMKGDVPRNPVADMLHMSGECLCGAFAKAGELQMLRDLGAPWTLPSIEQIRRLEAWWAEQPTRIQVSSMRKVYRGRFGWREESVPVWAPHPVPIERRTWGWGAYRDELKRRSKSGPLCSSCAAA